jgi:catechol 2,3-dioxygenase-like lactoylglutathione lyase family enzyme
MENRPRLGVVILAVRDLHRSVMFYQDALGWRLDLG